jgi:hypothetical protein
MVGDDRRPDGVGAVGRSPASDATIAAHGGNQTRRAAFDHRGEPRSVVASATFDLRPARAPRGTVRPLAPPLGPRGSLAREITADAQKVIAALGIELVDVRIKRVRRDPRS